MSVNEPHGRARNARLGKRVPPFLSECVDGTKHGEDASGVEFEGCPAQHSDLVAVECGVCFTGPTQACGKEQKTRVQGMGSKKKNELCLKTKAVAARRWAAAVNVVVGGGTPHVHEAGEGRQENNSEH